MAKGKLRAIFRSEIPYFSRFPPSHIRGYSSFGESVYPVQVVDTILLDIISSKIIDVIEIAKEISSTPIHELIHFLSGVKDEGKIYWITDYLLFRDDKG